MAANAKGWFDSLYALKDEAVAEAKRPFVEKKVARAFESAMDSLESAKIDQTEKIEKLKSDIANGATEKIKDLVSATLDLEEYDRQIVCLKQLKSEAFGK